NAPERQKSSLKSPIHELILVYVAQMASARGAVHIGQLSRGSPSTGVRALDPSMLSDGTRLHLQLKVAAIRDGGEAATHAHANEQDVSSRRVSSNTQATAVRWLAYQYSPSFVRDGSPKSSDACVHQRHRVRCQNNFSISWV